MKNKGIIPINKPKGWTSFDVVNKLKYKLKPLKVGHLGTLDPMATGVLLVTVGKATKLFDIMQEKHKTYIATFEFGYSTNTLDATGEIDGKCLNIPTKEEIEKVLCEFVGKIRQIPPKFSAKSINGKRAYELARNNEEFELKPKEVEIYNIQILSYENNILKLEIVCGSGTYIRSVGRDIANKLNSLATMIELVRTSIDQFSIKDCFDIRDIDDVEKRIYPIQKILNYPRLELNEEEKFKLLNGQVLNLTRADGCYMLNDDYDTTAIIEVKENKAKMSLFLG